MDWTETKAEHKHCEYVAGDYKIIWKPRFDGLDTYVALVKCGRVWDFCDRHDYYRSFEAAERACIHNRAVWNKFIALSKEPAKGRKEKFRDLKARSKGVLGIYAPSWVKASLGKSSILNLLNPKPGKRKPFKFKEQKLPSY